MDYKNNTQVSLDNDITVYSLKKLGDITKQNIQRLPYSIRVLAENILRNLDGHKVTEQSLNAILNWQAKADTREEIPYMPARVVMQDFTGVPAVVDFAAMRDDFKKAGGDPARINPMVRTDLVIDHSVQVDYFASTNALQKNVDMEFIRNRERYSLLKWGQNALADFKVVPPGMGIIHQVNLEYLASVVEIKDSEKNGKIAYPDTLVGTDSHTTMINGIGVMGWGVGGIEAEAVMLGQPYFMLLPDVIGVKLIGKLREGTTATDLVLFITEKLREYGVVAKFVEYFGEGLSQLPVPDRATIANMAPEYGATMGFFPVDEQTLHYLEMTNRGEHNDTVKAALEEFLLMHDTSIEPEYTDVLTINLDDIDSTIAGPKRPQDRVPLRQAKVAFAKSLTDTPEQRGFGLSQAETTKKINIKGMDIPLTHGSIVIAAITSCTNTSNPYVMVGAGLIAQNALKKGLSVKPFVKTSLAPGSQVVTEYLKNAGLIRPLEELGFNIVGYGCTTCIGNSGPLDENIVAAIDQGNLISTSILSGNRNFEGRINPNVKASYLASPILVIAYALFGNIAFDPENDALGNDKDGKPVYLKDIWPSNQDIAQVVEASVNAEMFADKYAKIFAGTAPWQKLDAPDTETFHWRKSSTYIRCPGFFAGFDRNVAKKDIIDARVLALLGDSVTTDHISPAGAIPEAYPAGLYLKDHGVSVAEFNTYGSRRGNHEVMMRGTFANTRIRNLLTPDVEGSYTLYHPEKKTEFIYDAAMQYAASNTPLIVIAGKEYGTGSSRDWAAKGTLLLGIKAVIAQSYERIHRSNLVGMGVLPLQFIDGQNKDSLKLNGAELYTIRGLNELSPNQTLEVQYRTENGDLSSFKVQVCLQTEIEVSYYQNGGILQTVLRGLL